MATVEVTIKCKASSLAGKYRACTLAGADGVELATARKSLASEVALALFAPAAIAFMVAIFGSGWGKAITWLCSMLLFVLAVCVQQLFYASRFRVAYRSSDGLGFRIINADPSTRLLPFSARTPSSFLVEGEGTGISAEFQLPPKGEREVIVLLSGTTAFTGQSQPPTGPKDRTKRLDTDFEDRAGRRATVAKQDRYTYRLVYDKGFQHDWLLLVVVATLLLR
jgi:hypothetical protein